ncbi:FMN-binding negative transcriptional regulator [Polynucleobacter sp.]|uniref:FMN-binding negative transcriptional regulator n=1 Tax=Polynucleobacter sp. TaxID=2029855 RepID=UPI0033424C1D
MYLPKHFEVTDSEILADLIEKYPLATLIGSIGDTMEINHLPLMLSKDRSRLFGHVAKANPLLKIAEQAVPNLTAVFNGPNAYVTPSWYLTKKETGKVVPTWNYAVVHAQGKISVIQDTAWLHGHVTQMTNTHEPTYQFLWKVDDAPDEYIQMMLNAIVGIEIEITSLVGKFKLSQNRPAEDYEAVLNELRASANQELQDMTHFMKPT